jgi:hypothetical protein
MQDRIYQKSGPWSTRPSRFGIASGYSQLSFGIRCIKSTMFYILLIAIFEIICIHSNNKAFIGFTKINSPDQFSVVK